MPDPTAPLSVSRLVLQAKRLEIESVRQLASRAELVDVIGQWIHALQRERGATSVFLGSQGRRFADVRVAAIAETAPVEARLRELFGVQLESTQGASARLLSMMAWVLLGLDVLADLRAQVERQALTGHAAVAAYSRLIAGPVELIFHVADAALLPDISRLLVALLHLVQGKEAAGQERAVGGLLFASGVCEDAHRQRALDLIEAQERSLQVYAEFAEPALRERWEQQQHTPGTARLERLRRTLGVAKPNGALDSNLSDAWFEACSERIVALWQAERDLVARLREDCEAQIAQAAQDLQDSEGLLRRLRASPPAHTHAVDHFFDAAAWPVAVPELVDTARRGGADSTSLLELVQAQSAQLAGMEAELGAARRALHERKVIERAKGVLMARLGLDEASAFRALQKTSMDQNMRLPDVAEATLALPDIAFAPAAQR